MVHDDSGSVSLQLAGGSSTLAPEQVVFLTSAAFPELTLAWSGTN